MTAVAVAAGGGFAAGLCVAGAGCCYYIQAATASPHAVDEGGGGGGSATAGVEPPPLESAAAPAAGSNAGGSGRGRRRTGSAQTPLGSPPSTGRQRAKQLALDAFYDPSNIEDRWKSTMQQRGMDLAGVERFAKLHPLVPMAVGIVNITSDWNVGALMRSAAVLSFSKFVILGRNKFDTRGAVGASRYITVDKFPAMSSASCSEVSLERLCEYLDGGGSDGQLYTPIFLEQGGAQLSDLQWRRAYAGLPAGRQFLLLVGNEGLGVPKKLVDAMLARYPGSFLLSIEQWGLMRSLNVAVATGIALYHAAQWHATTYGAGVAPTAVAMTLGE
eukprot:SAG22_NODE_1437_length_4419_cov_3.228472_2_plen_330_part_00